MRIIAGRWRGRPLVAPPGQETRPTADRVRETLFSMLTSRLGSFDGLAVADLFAGSGALGLEALSRGAASCLFVEQDRAAIDAIRSNVARLGAERTDVRAGRAEQAASAAPLDLVFADAPYGSGLGSRAIGHLLHRGGLAPGALACVETARGESAAVADLTTLVERDVARARLTILRHD